jgi:hypothetical protein
MFTKKSIIQTERASAYLQQLCKHFSHKINVQFDTEAGQINFPFGKCTLAATATELELTASAKEQADLTKTARVIASHLERFAFRENPKIEWEPAADHAPS